MGTIHVLEQIYENNLYPCKPQFYYIKVGCKGVYITQICMHDGLMFCLYRNYRKKQKILTLTQDGQTTQLLKNLSME